ncbi:PEP-CTERM sorting domain-containing protein [Massilia dura]|uniref:PEP-CTERM sorting domain-containing protein n=2 Tax=Pseudoduganella dura TaxID=321982 RepID=A0A6I3XIQ1_9BURK|nr:PEP-CTERM sorting domain-containing protein [Pseudoduganella dura]
MNGNNRRGLQSGAFQWSSGASRARRKKADESDNPRECANIENDILRWTDGGHRSAPGPTCQPYPMIAMKISRTTLLAGAALMLGTTATAATIDTHSFTFQTSSSDLVLLSETATTAQIQINSLAWSADSANIDSGGSSLNAIFDATVKEGYRITSFTISANLTGVLDVVPLGPGCGQTVASCRLGTATNRAELRWVMRDGSAEALVERRDFAGQEVLSATTALPLSLQGEFSFVTESTLYVAATDGEVYQQGSDLTTYFPSRAFAGFSSPVVLTVQVAAVPEPGTYAMLLAGLGLLGWIARSKGRAGAA